MDVAARLKRIDMTKLWPEFQARIFELMPWVPAFHAISGYRSVAEQNELHAQGRTKPGKIVTNAKGGESFHNFGIAADFAFDTDEKAFGLQPGWELETYRPLANAVTAIEELESGFFWKFTDPGHVQIDLARLGLTLSDLRRAHTHGGVPNVFALLDLHAAAL